jgi:DNA-binding transcriptional LysR family regulator
VTQLVQQLEARLRVKLLNRTTRKVNVTADGAAYYERSVRVLADLDDAETSLSHAAAQPRGRLRVDVPSPLASLILVPALPAFHERYPEIQLDMGVSDRVVDVIGENVDCVVPLFEDWHLDSMPLYLAFPPKRHVSAKLRVFIDWIVELMARHAPIVKR